MNKFKVGDIVIGNEKATFEYTYTTEGYIGTVIKIHHNGRIRIQSERDIYDVKPEFFDLYKRTEVKSNKPEWF